MILKNIKFANAFSILGTGDLSVETTILIEEFFCQLYGYKNIANINEVKYRIFEAKIKPTNSKKPLKFLKSVNPMLFPPCQKVLLYI